MGAFDYKSYTSAESVDLATLSYTLAAQSFFQTRILGVRLDDAATYVEGTLGVGAVTGGKIATDPPPGWVDLSAAAIGFEGARIDADGFIQPR